MPHYYVSNDKLQKLRNKFQIFKENTPPGAMPEISFLYF